MFEKEESTSIKNSCILIFPHFVSTPFISSLVVMQFNDGEWLICLTRKIFASKFTFLEIVSFYRCLQNVETTNWRFFCFLLFSGRRRVSLWPNLKLNHCPKSASSHYFSLCKLNLAIPVILLLLSTTIDVTGKWWRINIQYCLPHISDHFYAFCCSQEKSNNMTSFIRHFDHISAVVCGRGKNFFLHHVSK